MAMSDRNGPPYPSFDYRADRLHLPASTHMNGAVSELPGASKRMFFARALVVLALILVGMFYLYPRLYDLTATPYRLDQTIVSANNYNPALVQVIEHEEITLGTFDSLDSMNASLAAVLETDATVTTELTTLIGQISDDMQTILNSAGTNVSELVTSLDTLTVRISSLQSAADGATDAVAGNRSTMDVVLTDARSTAAEVRSARLSAEEAANDLSGK